MIGIGFGGGMLRAGQIVDDFDALAAISNPSNGNAVLVRGKSSVNDGGGGIFIYQSSPTVSEERLRNGSFVGGSYAWSVVNADGSHIATFSGGTLRFQSDTTSPQLVVQQTGVLEVGKTYQVTCITDSWTSGVIKTDIFGTSDTLANSAGGTVVVTGVANSTTFSLTRNGTNVDITLASISVREVVSDNEGSVIDGWVRLDQQGLNLKWFGAIGDGLTDDYDAIMLAHDALPKTGGLIYVPGGKYLHNTAITFTKKIKLIGDGVGDNEAGSTSIFLKGAGISGDGVSLTGLGSTIEGIAFVGENGNSGDGLVVKAGRVSLKNVGAYTMGNDGVRIGTDSGGENCNLWYIENLKSKSNGNDGLAISEGSGGGADSNGGTLVHTDVQSNTRHGIYLGNTQLNTFNGVTSQSNGDDGVHLSADASYNAIFGGDYEGNTGDEIFITSGAVENKIIGGVIGGTIVDNGTRTIIDGLSGTSLNANSQLNIVTVKGLIVPLDNAPSSASDTGTAGEIRADASYIYICTATDTWERAPIASW